MEAGNGKSFTSGSEAIISLEDDEEIIAPAAGAFSGASSGSAVDGASSGLAVDGASQTAAGVEAVGAAAAGTPAAGELPKSSRKKSTVWNHFDTVIYNKQYFNVCKHCGKRYKADSNRYGTSTMHGHIKTCTKNPAYRKSQLQLAFTPFDQSKEASLTSWRFDQDACRNALTKMLVMDELPFSFVEGEGFKSFMKIACPHFKIHSRVTYMRSVFGMYESEKLKLHAYFKSSSPRVSLTTDTWTSCQQVNYMCLTAHFIDDDWVLHKRIINFTPIGSHTGVDICKAICGCLHSWGLDKIMTITVDNASANDKAVEQLSNKMNALSTTVLGGEFMHMRCIAHILNLIVHAGLDQIGRSVEKIRTAVRFIRLSPMRLNRFKLAVKHVGIDSKKLLSYDVCTRWNSTFAMLDAACSLEKAFEEYELLDPNLNAELDKKLCKDDNTPLERLCEQDWANCRACVSFLKKFYDLTNKVSGSSYATSNLILDCVTDIYLFIKKGLASTSSDMRSMSNLMAAKYNKYFGNVNNMNLLIFIAPVLDPRKKLSFVNYTIEHLYPADQVALIIPRVKYILDSMYAEYVKLYDKNVESSSKSVMGNDDGDFDTDMMFASYKRLKSSQEVLGRTELEKYLREDDVEDKPMFNVLTWWKQNASRYPIISRMARDLLSIPISTVSSESAFSAGSRILNPFRSSLLPLTVQALICTQDWLKSNISSLQPMMASQGMDSLTKLMEDLRFEEDIVQAASTVGAPILF